MDLSDITGSYGPWQRRVFLVFFYINTVGIWQTFSITFLAPNVEFKCVEPPPLPLHYLNTSTFDEQCEVPVSNSTTPCTRWEYDTANFSHTIVSEWDLVCDRQWLVSLAKSVYMFGFLVSVIVFGQMSDWLGRYPTVVTCYVISLVSMFLSVLSSSYTMFVVLRFFQALGRTGLSTVGIVLVMELMGPNHRTEANVALQVGWAVGFSLLPAVAWFVRHWFWFQLVLALSLLPFSIAFWIVPESPRWLLIRGKKKRLEQTLAEAVKINRRDTKMKELDLLKEHGKSYQEENRKTLFHLLKMPKMRNRTFILIYLWNVNTFMYFGLSLNTNDTAGDPYLNFFIAGLLEFPSLALLWWGTKYAGRRPTFMWCMYAAGAASLAMLVVPQSTPWLTTVFAMTGKLFVTSSFGLLYIYTNELFPTVVRNVSLGTCSMCARVGSILAPFVRELGQATHPSVPNVLYGVLALTSGLLALLLPETRGTNMPDTMEEGEAFGE